VGTIPPGALTTDWLTANQITGTDALGTTAGFTNYGGATLTSSIEEAHSGVKSLKVVTPSAVVDEGVFLQTPGQSYAVNQAAQGQQWYLSTWVKAPLGATLRLQFVERNAAGAYVAYQMSPFTGTGIWQQVTISRTLTHATVVQLDVLVITDVSAQAITFYVDDIELYRTDMTGNAHAAITGAVWAAGPNGVVLRFDAVDDYAKIQGDLIGTGARTIEALIKPTSGAIATPHIISNRECRLWVDWAGGANRLGFGRASATSIYSANSAEWLTANQITGTDALGTTEGFANYAGATLTSSIEEAHGGTKSLKVVTAGAVTAEGPFLVTPGQDYAVNQAAQGQQWYLSTWVKAPLGATLRLQLIERNAAGAYVAYQTSPFTGTGIWQQVILSRTLTGATVTQLDVLVITDVSAQAISFYVDDIELYRTDSIVSGAWQQVLVSSDAAGATSLYVNGVLKGGAGQAAGTPAKGADTFIGNLAALTMPFGGDIALVCVYNKAVSAVEAQESYRRAAWRLGLPG